MRISERIMRAGMVFSFAAAAFSCKVKVDGLDPSQNPAALAVWVDFYEATLFRLPPCGALTPAWRVNHQFDLPRNLKHANTGNSYSYPLTHILGCTPGTVASSVGSYTYLLTYNSERMITGRTGGAGTVTVDFNSVGRVTRVYDVSYFPELTEYDNLNRSVKITTLDSAEAVQDQGTNYFEGFNRAPVRSDYFQAGVGTDVSFQKTDYAGGLIQKITRTCGENPGGTCSNETLTFTYDGEGRLVAETFASGSTGPFTYTYDSEGRVATAADQTSGDVVTYTWGNGIITKIVATQAAQTWDFSN